MSDGDGIADAVADTVAGTLGGDSGGNPGGGLGWGWRAGVAGAAIGVVAAGVAVERLTVHRSVRRRARAALDASAPYGSLRGRPGTATAEDGTLLYFETDDPDVPDVPDDPDAPDAADGPGDPGAPAQPSTAPTVVFSHGYCLHQDSWHFQRAALRGLARTVHWDQRSHGRSGRAPAGEPVSIDLLGRDLKAVLDAAVPDGPIVLVGHSMGGMTMMALADQYPEFVAERVVGVAFVSTSSGGLGEVTYGLPAAGMRAVRRFVPGALRAMAGQAELVERGRRAAADLLAGLVRRYSFGSPREVDPSVARFAERMIESVPVDVVAEFYPAFAEHDKAGALSAFAGLPALVLAGDRDQLTPPAHSEAIAALLPGAELRVVENAGHLVLLERPGLVSECLAALLARTIRTHGSSAAAAESSPPPGRADGRASGAGRDPRAPDHPRDPGAHA